MNFGLAVISAKRTTTRELAVKPQVARLAAGKAATIVKIKACHDMEFGDRCEQRPLSSKDKKIGA